MNSAEIEAVEHTACYSALTPEGAIMLELLVKTGQVQLVSAIATPSRPAARPPTRSEINRANARKRWDKPRPTARQEMVASKREKPSAACDRESHGAVASNCMQDTDLEREFALSHPPKLKLEELRSSKPAKLAKLARSAEMQFVRVTKIANEEAGLSLDRTDDYGQVRKWLQDGIPECVILTIAGIVPRPPVAQHLGYFGPAIREAFNAMDPGAADCVRSQAVWQSKMVDWVNAGRPGAMPRLTREQHVSRAA